MSNEIALKEVGFESGVNLFSIISSALIPIIGERRLLSCNNEFYSKYGDRLISTYLEFLVDTESFETNFSKYAIPTRPVTDLILSRFEEKWAKLNSLKNIEYDPLSPFEITYNEDSTDDLETKVDTSSYTDNDSTYAFNSETPVPTDVSSGENSRAYKRENPKHREYERKGNIGNTSRQKLVEEERRVLEYQILETIYTDIASVLCRNSYKNY